MSKKISIEVGHGGADPGAVSGNIYEKNINLVVALELKRQLERHGLKVLISREKDINDKAADFYKKAAEYKPDIGLSVHANAFDGTARGFEVYRNTNSFKSQSTTLCQRIETEVKALGQSSRGVKDSPFLMSSLSCPTAYLELGFLDNPSDYAKFNTEAKQKSFAVGYAKGILNYLGVKWQNEGAKPGESGEQPQPVFPGNPGVMWRVIAGSFLDKNNATAQVNELKRKGIESFIAEYKL